MNRWVKLLLLITWFVVIANFVLIIAYVLSNQDHSPTSPSITIIKGQQGTIGLQGTPGYQGIQGMQGSEGLQGSNGGAGLQGPTGPAGAQGEPGPAGPTGEAASPAREVELRYSDDLDQLQWRYVGNLSWNKLVDTCQLLKACL